VSLFRVLHSRTHYRRYRGRRVRFSCFAFPDSFSTVPRASGSFFMFCAHRLVFDGTKGVRSLFSCLARPDSFSMAPSASSPVFLFCTPGLVFVGTEGVGSCFHVLCSRTRFRRYRGRLVPFSRFALPDSFSAVPRASGPVVMCCAPGLVIIFGGDEYVGSRFHILTARTCFRR
jgi:hypothetical protein